MNRAERRKILKGTMKFAPTGYGLDQIEDEGARSLLVAICRACIPDDAQGILGDGDLVAAFYELVRNDFLDVYIKWHGKGCDVFTELKEPGKGSVSIMGPYPAIRFVGGSVH